MSFSGIIQGGMKFIGFLSECIGFATQAKSLWDCFYNTRQEKQNRELQREIDKNNMNQQYDLEKRKIDISDRQLQLLQEIASNNRRLKLDLAKQEFENRIYLFSEQRKLQKELAIFNANTQYQIVKEHAKLQAESSFSTSHYPLFVRLSSYQNAGMDIVNKIKILLSPPTVIFSDETNEYNGSDVIITSYITKYLQDSIPAQLYEFLGCSWRDDMHRAQSAYRNIYNELADMPVLIIDNDITRGYFSFRICFWTSGSEDYSIKQIITNYRVDSLLKESVRTRVDIWKKNIADPLLQKGKTKEDLMNIFPLEMRNYEILKRDEDLLNLIGNKYLLEPSTSYSYSPEDYDYCLRIISALSAVSVGMFLDMYHILNRNIDRPCFLKKMSSIIDTLPNSIQCNIRKEVKDWIIEEYKEFSNILQKKIEEQENSHLDLASVFINERIDLIYTMRILGEDKEADILLQESLDYWAKYMLGFSWDIFVSEENIKARLKSIVGLMLLDRGIAKQIFDFCSLCKDRRPQEYVFLEKLVDEYRRDVLF